MDISLCSHSKKKKSGFVFPGSLTLHHWQQLAKPHLATILDPHPGVVTKGFRPLAQDAVYHLSDMEEDEEDEELRGPGVQEKGAAERGKEDEEEEEEEGGITFKVRYTSTPEERKERKQSASLPVLPVSPTVSSSSSSSVRSDPCLTPRPRLVTETSSLSPQPAPGASTATVQPQTQICTSASTTASSSGKSSTVAIKTYTVLCSDVLLIILSCSVQNPGKCQSSTFSTYTFTTCRILHPSDVTQVTPR